MSYCVHCGVKLASYQKVCPLCGTVVLDPHPEEPDHPKYVDKIDTNDRHVNRYFLTRLIVIISFIPVAVTVLVNFLVSGTLSWSIYVAGADLCFLTFIVIPFRFYFSNKYWYIILDSIVLILYMYMIGMVIQQYEWVNFIAVPIVLFTGLCSCLTVLVFSLKKQTLLSIIGWTILINSALPLVINIIVNNFIQHKPWISWAYWVSIPTFVLGFILIVIDRNEKLKSWIKKNIFI